MDNEQDLSEGELNRKRDILLDYLKKNEEELQRIKEQRQKEKKKATLDQLSIKKETKAAPADASLEVRNIVQPVPPVPAAVNTGTDPVTPANDSLIVQTLAQEDQGAVELANISQERLRLESLSNKRALLEMELSRPDDNDQAGSVEDKKSADQPEPTKAQPADDGPNMPVYATEENEVEAELKSSDADAEPDTASADRQSVAAMEARHHARKIEEIESHKKLVKILEHRANRRAMFRQQQRKLFGSATQENPEPAAESVPAAKTAQACAAKLKQFVGQINFAAKRWIWGGLALAFGLYLCFLIIVYTFAPDFILFKKASQYMPAPAMLSTFGLIDYYDFQRIKNTETREPGEDVMFSVLKNQALEAMARKYDVYSGLQKDLLVKVLERRVIEDLDVNLNPAKQYRQLKLAVRTSGSIEEVAKKTGLEVRTKKYSRKLLIEQFGTAIADLPIGEMSGLVLNSSGVYVISPFYYDEDNQAVVKYIFVPARTLDQLITEQMNNSWIVSFVN